MAASKRIVVSVPYALLTEVDGLVATERWNRSALVREAVRIYVEERKKRDMQEQMIRGYQEMARINLSLAEEGPVFDLALPARGRAPLNE